MLNLLSTILNCIVVSAIPSGVLAQEQPVKVAMSWEEPAKQFFAE